MSMMNRTDAELILQALTGGEDPSDWSVPRFSPTGWHFGRPDLIYSPLAVDKDSRSQNLPAVVSAIDPGYYVPANMYQSINNAISAVKDDYDNWWGIVEIPPGIHVLADEIVLTGSNAYLRGFGSVGSEGVGGGGGAYGSGGGVTQLVVPATAGKRGVVYYNGNNIFDGPTIENIHVIGNATAAGGFNIRKTNNFRLNNCGSGLFSTGYDFWFEGAGSISQYGRMENLMCYGSKYGIKLTEVSGMRFYGCTLSGNRNAAITTIANSKGVWGAYPDNGSNQFFGLVVQGYANLIDFESDENSMFFGTRMEDWTTNAIKLSIASGGRTKGFQFYGGSISNYLASSVGTVLNIETGVTETLFICSNVAGYTTLRTDTSGLETNHYWINGEHLSSNLITYGRLMMKDGITAPSAATGFAQIYVDTADGDLKVIFGDGTVKTIVVDT